MTLVMTLLLKGGLCQVMLRLRFHFWVFWVFLRIFNSAYWYQLFFKAVSYSNFVLFKIYRIDYFLCSLLLIDISMCLMTWGGWFIFWCIFWFMFWFCFIQNLFARWILIQSFIDRSKHLFDYFRRLVGRCVDI